MRVAVVGDVLLDVDVTGSADRLSPDAPVPVLDVDRRVVRAGGAGLAATFLARDGVAVDLVTALADDARADELRAALPASVHVVAGPSGAPTPVKTRVRTGDHAIARIDEGCAPPPPPRVTDAMVEAVLAADAILVSDYGRGVASDPRLRTALERRARTVPLVWDPHPRGAEPVPGTAVATPNVAEASRAAGVAGAGIAGAADAARRLLDSWRCSAVVVTLGSSGALLATADAARAPLVHPAPTIAVVDPCGAGDRFAATLARELAAGHDLAASLPAAIADAATFLAAGGVAALAEPEAPVELGGEAASALGVAHRVRGSGGTVVATGGCFDLLHAGHARTLSAARSLGDCLIVCLNSDESVRRLKGPERPLMPQEDRADLLLALECVDAVLVFDEDTPEEALRRLRPDIWVKGGDYSVHELPEARLLEQWGGRTVTVPFYPGRSTSTLVRKLALVG